MSATDAFRRIHRVQTITIAWMSVEAIVSLFAAWRARSPALLAFGGDSAIELFSAVVVLWRFRATAAQCFKMLSRHDAPEWILEGDIKGCFDHISHSWMLNHIPMDTGILEKWLKSGYLEQANWFATEAGTPQGVLFRRRWPTSLWMDSKSC